MKNDNLKAIGNRARLARVSCGLSQSEVAAAGGPSRPILSKIELGKPVESLDTQIQRMALIYRVPTDYISKGSISAESPMGAAETPTPYLADPLDTQLLSQCCAAVLEAVEREVASRPPASKLGAVIAEVYTICQRDRRQPTDDLVASFMRVLLA